MRNDKGQFIKGHEPHKNWIRKWDKRVKNSCGMCKKIFLANKNRHRKYCSKYCADKARVGKVPWNRGISQLSSINKLIRKSKRFTIWRNSVFKRDNYTCIDCSMKGGSLHPHHIKKLSEMIKEFDIKTINQAIKCKQLWEVKNGQTLCKDCHQKHHCVHLTTYRPKKLTCSNCGKEYRPHNRGNWRNGCKHHFCNRDCQYNYLRKFGNSNQFSAITNYIKL